MSRESHRLRLFTLATLALLTLPQFPALAADESPSPMLAKKRSDARADAQPEAADKPKQPDKSDKPQKGEQSKAQPNAQFKAQLKWYAAQIAKFPNQAELYYQLGLLQAQTDAQADAAASFASALRLDAGMYKAVWQLARLELEQNQPQKAIDTLTPALTRWRVEPEFYYLLGLSHQQLGQKSQALSAFEKVVLLAPGHVAQSLRDTLRRELSGQKVADAASLHAKVAALIQQKSPVSAQQALISLLDQHPEDQAGYDQLAGMLEATGQFAPAALWREQLQALNPCYGNNSALLGRWRLWTGFLERAAALLQNQLACRPTVEAARWLGQLYRQRGSWDLALAHYKAWLPRWAGDAELLSGQAATLVALGRMPEASASIAQIKVPGPEALFVRSQIALASGQAADAIRDLKLAVAANNRPEYHKALGMAYAQAGMGEPARQELIKYLQAKPAEAASLQALLEQLKTLPKRGRFEN